jgi:hypothetical protein
LSALILQQSLKPVLNDTYKYTLFSFSALLFWFTQNIFKFEMFTYEQFLQLSIIQKKIIQISGIVYFGSTLQADDEPTCKVSKKGLS